MAELDKARSDATRTTDVRGTVLNANLRTSRAPGLRRHVFLGLAALLLAGTLLFFTSAPGQHAPASLTRDHDTTTAMQGSPPPPPPTPVDVAIDFTAGFYASVRPQDTLCVGTHGRSASHAGHIGLRGDSDARPKRSFFWLFEAQSADSRAPVILTTGGGPGTTGMLNPLMGQAHCAITKDGLVPSPHAWTEHYNLLALDHPIGVGFSYGTHVNTSRAAAVDAYDFLQKFYTLFPHLAKNPLVLASGSYGGTYVPHMATVIHEQNLAIQRGEGQPGAQHIPLASMMVSNPYSDTLSHYRWALQQRCYYTDFFNATLCAAFYERLPFCLEALQSAFDAPTAAHRVHAIRVCSQTQAARVEGRSYENVNYACDGSFEGCFPEGVWLADLLNRPETKAALGVPAHLNFTTLSDSVFAEFLHAGDLVQAPRLLYEPLLAAGIRLLHFIGKLDANCAWPGVISMLKLIQSPHQAAFVAAPDLPWTGEHATVRVVGAGAGDMTYVLMDDAGHMVVKDEPALVRKVVEYWMENRTWEV